VIGRTFLFAVLALLTPTSAAARIECHTASPGIHSSWRQIDGRTCWYQGSRNISKSELFWPVTTSIHPQHKPIPARPWPAPQPVAATFSERWPH
jgi:hypothetical protein